MKKTLNIITDESMVDRLTMEELEEMIGSGSGSGSGSGATYYISEGQQISTLQPFFIRITWDSGIANVSDSAAEITVEVISSNPHGISPNNTCYRWCAPYTIYIEIQFTLGTGKNKTYHKSSMNFNIPEQYRNN